MLIQWTILSFCILSFGLHSGGVVKEFNEVFKFEGMALRGCALMIHRVY